MKHPDCDEEEQESCEDCEFRISRKSGPGIGTVLSGERGEFDYCEKGFWKVET